MAHAQHGMEPERHERPRRRGRFLLALLVMAGVCAFAVYRSALFRLERVQLDGAHRLTEPRILEAAGLSVGAPRWENPASAIEARLRQEPWIKDVNVTWYWSVLRVQIEEREPVALMPYQDRFYLVLDETGMILEQTQLTAARGMPVISGKVLTKALRGQAVSDQGVLDALALVWHMDEKLKSQVDQVSVDAKGELTLFMTSGGATVRWGPLPVGKGREEKIITQLETFGDVWFNKLSRPIKVGCLIDMRLERQGRPLGCN